MESSQKWKELGKIIRQPRTRRLLTRRHTSSCSCFPCASVHGDKQMSVQLGCCFNETEIHLESILPFPHAWMPPGTSTRQRGAGSSRGAWAGAAGAPAELVPGARNPDAHTGDTAGTGVHLPRSPSPGLALSPGAWWESRGPAPDPQPQEWLQACGDRDEAAGVLGGNDASRRLEARGRFRPCGSC